MREDGEFRSFYQTSNDNNEGGPVGEWVTREIHNEIVGEPEYNKGFKWFEMTSDSVKNGNETLLELVSENATLIHVGTGGSSFGGDVITNFCIDKLQLDGHPVGHFPVEGRGGNCGNSNGRGE